MTSTATGPNQIVVKGSTPSSYDGLQTISAVTSNTGNNAAQQLTKYSAGTAAWVALGTGAAGVNTVLT